GLDGSDVHPLLKAAGFHAMFENIHPFMDGNGRTGRQLLNFILLGHGYRPVAIKYDAGRAYARSLEAWQVDGDPTSFCSIFLDCVEQEERAFIDLVETLRREPEEGKSQSIHSGTDSHNKLVEALHGDLVQGESHDGKNGVRQNVPLRKLENRDQSE
ncbi:Fic family protein, partial [Bifidobacterium pseudocatenulatum]